MNIFFTNRDPYKAAQNLNFYPKLRNKMILETAQLFFTAAAHFDLKVPYKPTHKKHPCTLWACASLSNMMWLYEHAKALNEEYKKSQAKPKVCWHKSFELMDAWMQDNSLFLHEMVPDFGLTLPYLAFGDENWELRHKFGVTIPRRKRTALCTAKSYEHAELGYRAYLETKDYAQDLNISWL